MQAATEARFEMTHGAGSHCSANGNDTRVAQAETLPESQAFGLARNHAWKREPFTSAEKTVGAPGAPLKVYRVFGLSSVPFRLAALLPLAQKPARYRRSSAPARLSLMCVALGTGDSPQRAALAVLCAIKQTWRSAPVTI